MRVSGDPNPDNNGLFFHHSDHLGNVSALSYHLDGNGNVHSQQGEPVATSTALPDPFGFAQGRLFGDWRTTPDTNPRITDRGFTSHRHSNAGENDLGLV